MNKKKLRNLMYTLAAIIFVIAGVGIIHIWADTASVSVTEIDYENLTLTVQANAEDSRVFFATTKTASVWEEIPGGVDEKQQATMDISWISASGNVSLYLKGDKSKNPVKVVVPKQNTKFKAKFNTLDNTIKFSNMKDAKAVYWKKTNSSEWILFQSANEAEQKKFANMIENFCTKGITLQFRTAQVKGTSAEQVGARPSKVSSVTISKRATAPSVSLNYSTLMFGAKKTLEYKLSDSETWMDVSSQKLYLEDVIPKAIYNEGIQTEELEDTISVDFRTKATSSKIASQICTLQIPMQKNTLLDNVIFSYTGSKQCKIEIIKKELSDEIVLDAASSTNPYEYTIVKAGDTFDVHTAKWTTITSETTKISSSIAPKGSLIYLRKKATSSELATKAVVVSEGLDYPNQDTLDQEAELTKIQGVEKENTFTIVVSNKDTKVSSIKFNNVEAGFKASDAVKNAETGKYLITVTINDTKDIEAVSANLSTKMEANIILTNTETITKGVSLYIAKAASVKSTTYTKYKGVDFEPEDKTDAVSFDVNLNEADKTDVVIHSITYNGMSVEYTATKDDTNNKYVVSIGKEKIDALQNYVKQSSYGNPVSLVVTLSNKEVLDGVKVKVAYPVTVSAENSSMGISISSYKAYQEKIENEKKKNSDETTTTETTTTEKYPDPVITYTINSAVMAKNASFYLKSFTWNGTNVLDNYTASNNGGTFKVTVSLAKLVTANPGSANLTLTLVSEETGQEMVVDYGYHITVTD